MSSGAGAALDGALLCVLSVLACGCGGGGGDPASAAAQTHVFVDDFGAVGDGATWDHAAIQAAINAAGDDGIVEFASGKTYVCCKQVIVLRGQMLLGNGATIKRCDAPTTFLVEDALAGDDFLLVDDPGVFEFGQDLTPVKGAGGVNDMENGINHWLNSVQGQRLGFAAPLTQEYPAGSVVTVRFDQIFVTNTSVGVTIDGLTLDGNRAKNTEFRSWKDNRGVRGYTGLSVQNSVFTEMPGNGMTVFGTDVLIERNSFFGLDGPMIHLSGNAPIDGSTVTIRDNLVKSTNHQSVLMEHSEGVITISSFNDSVIVERNVVSDAPVPFIARFHADMQNWEIRGNIVVNTAGAFFAKVFSGSPLRNVLWERNTFVDVGESRTLRQPGAEPITNWSMVENRIVGGSLELHGLREGAIVDNRILSCQGVDPLVVSDGSEVDVNGNLPLVGRCLPETVTNEE